MIQLLTSIYMLVHAYTWCFLIRFAMQWIDPAGKSPASRLLGVVTQPVVNAIGPRAVVNGINYAPVGAFFMINMCVGTLYTFLSMFLLS